MLQMKDFTCIFHGVSRESHQTAQYHDATNDMLYVNLFMKFPMYFATTAQYHDATNDGRDLIFSWYLFHAIHQNASVPQCYK